MTKRETKIVSGKVQTVPPAQSAKQFAKRSVTQLAATQPSASRRILYLDFIRIIAAFLIVGDSVLSLQFEAVFSEQAATVSGILLVAYFFITKLAVPLFFMVSGALLLSGSQTTQKTLKRLWRIIVILVIFSIIYYLVLTPNESWSLNGFLRVFLSGKITTPLWFLYIYAVLLLLTPALTLLVKKISPKAFVCLTILVLLVNGTVPLITYNSGAAIGDITAVLFLSMYVVFYLGGYYLHSADYAWLKKRLTAIVAAILALAIIVALTVATFAEYAKGASGDTLVAVLAFIIFYLCRRLFLGRELPRIADFTISPMGVCTFGIYLFHIYVLLSLSDWLYFMAAVMPPLLVSISLQVIVFAFCLIPTYLLRKIPIVEKYL